MTHIFLIPLSGTMRRLCLAARKIDRQRFRLAFSGSASLGQEFSATISGFLNESGAGKTKYFRHAEIRPITLSHYTAEFLNRAHGVRPEPECRSGKERCPTVLGTVPQSETHNLAMGNYSLAFGLVVVKLSREPRFNIKQEVTFFFAKPETLSKATWLTFLFPVIPNGVTDPPEESTGIPFVWIVRVSGPSLLGFLKLNLQVVQKLSQARPFVVGHSTGQVNRKLQIAFVVGRSWHDIHNIHRMSAFVKESIGTYGKVCLWQRMGIRSLSGSCDPNKCWTRMENEQCALKDR